MSPLSAGGGILPSFLVSTPTETSDAGAPLRGCPTVSDKSPLPRGGGGSTLRLIQSVCLGTYGLRRRCCQRHQSLPCFPGPWSCRPSCGGGSPLSFPVAVCLSPLYALGTMPPPGVPGPITLVVGRSPLPASFYLFVCPSPHSRLGPLGPPGVPGLFSLALGGSPVWALLTPSLPHPLYSLLVKETVLPPHHSVGRVERPSLPIFSNGRASYSLGSELEPGQLG